MFLYSNKIRAQVLNGRSEEYVGGFRGDAGQSFHIIREEAYFLGRFTTSRNGGCFGLAPCSKKDARDLVSILLGTFVVSGFPSLFDFPPLRLTHCGSSLMESAASLVFVGHAIWGFVSCRIGVGWVLLLSRLVGSPAIFIVLHRSGTG